MALKEDRVLSQQADTRQSTDSQSNSSERFKLIFNASPDMIFIIGHNGLILDANESAIETYGYDRNQLFGMSYEKLFPKHADLKRVNKLFDSAKSGSEIDYEWITATRSGKQIPVDVRLRSLRLNENDTNSAVVLFLTDMSLRQKADEAINSLARATNLLEFKAFLEESIRSLAELYGTKFAFVGRLQPDEQSVETLCVWAGDRFVDNFTYSLEGTPCKDVMDLKVELIPEKADESYPDDELLIQMGIKSYFGSPMIAEKKMMGLVSVMDDKPMDIDELSSPVLSLFANRLAIEVERFEINQELQKNKENLELLVKERTKTIEEQSQELKESHTALEHANDEMKSFCYSVSHDLRAPLRGISGFSTAVLEDYEDKLDELGKEYLTRIKDGTERMSTLIDDLLQLSRVSHYDPEMEDIHLTSLANDLMLNLKSIEPDRKVEIVFEDELECFADRGLMTILLQNLLGNAWKYSGKSESARIEFGKVDQEDGQTTFFIKDNGSGFDMRHAGFLFQPFKRLHGEAEFPGTGIGLATVKRIMNLHDGDIWAEGKVGEGATFYFSLPDR